MGGGRKTETVIVGEPSARPSPAGFSNVSAKARNLRQSELGGVIFGCKNHTISECLKHQIFGLPGPHFSYVRSIKPGLPLFLFNYTERMLHGIYEAASHGQLNIDPRMWAEDEAQRSPFPAQVRINIKVFCQPIPESIFRSAIEANYYGERHFYFELDHAQVERLMSMFKPTMIPGYLSNLSNETDSMVVPHKSQNERLSGSISSYRQKKGSNNSKQQGITPASTLGKNKYATLSWDDTNDGGSLPSETEEITDDDNAEIEVASDWEELCGEDNSDPYSFVDHFVDMERHKQMIPESPETIEESINQRENVFGGPQIMATYCDHGGSTPCSPSSDEVVEFTEQSVNLPSEMDSIEILTKYKQAELINVIKELKARTLELENKQVEAERELDLLRKHSCRKINTLEEQVKELETKLASSAILAEECSQESPIDNNLGSQKLIYLVGGHNGEKWLNTLDSYSTSSDILTHITPMRSTCSYSASVALDGYIYRLGGCNTGLCYNSVECYSPRNDKWMSLPSFNRGRGGLSGATLNGQIYAIGGGNEKESFSDVEMLDMHCGKWVHIWPMLQKRFGLSTIELNGAFYAVGGFDGANYLNYHSKEI